MDNTPVKKRRRLTDTSPSRTPSVTARKGLAFTSPGRSHAGKSPSQAAARRLVKKSIVVLSPRASRSAAHRLLSPKEKDIKHRCGAWSEKETRALVEFVSMQTELWDPDLSNNDWPQIQDMDFWMKAAEYVSTEADTSFIRSG
ncbi:hypothetical protein Bbelb_410420 [Branchiostoma belcheri]|nr:hypothetical protein Bbelb_410420 [Branchiostoma belcheri]